MAHACIEVEKRKQMDPSQTMQYSRRMLASKFRDAHQRLVVRRQKAWGERTSDSAADNSVRFFEYMFVGYAQVMPFLALFVVLKQLGFDALANAIFGISLILGLSCFLIALHYGRQAGVDIARSYGLPDSAWRRVKARTPAQFDGWLAKERAKNRSPGLG
jgi:hypothetical protein